MSSDCTNKQVANAMRTV